jgi:hypothetical protein
MKTTKTAPNNTHTAMADPEFQGQVGPENIVARPNKTQVPIQRTQPTQSISLRWTSVDFLLGILNDGKKNKKKVPSAVIGITT